MLLTCGTQATEIGSGGHPRSIKLSLILSRFKVFINQGCYRPSINIQDFNPDPGFSTDLVRDVCHESRRVRVILKEPAIGGHVAGDRLDSQRIIPVRSGSRRGVSMAYGASPQDSGKTLECNILDVVFRIFRRQDGMRRSVTGTAEQPAVAFGLPEQFPRLLCII